jgi:16S rRNA (cytosine1402-N4)-methyltransferase
MSYHHQPVLMAETLNDLAPERGGVFVDCTLGGGGHSRALLERGATHVVGIDRDRDALAAAQDACKAYADRLEVVHGSFGDLSQHLDRAGIDQVDGILADLGVSSHQLDTASRGFSFRHEGPVDMRMDQSAALSAAEVVNTWSADELADRIREYGEERHARRVARTIVEGRPWGDTRSLADAIARTLGRGKQRIHPATRTFQALRILVNDELGELKRLLPAAVEHLRPCGRLAVISFHSLEDRITKQFMARSAGRGVERDPYGHPLVPPTMRLLSPKTASAEETNPRARSARLRTAVRLPCTDR